MVVQVGDKVLVYGAGTPWAFAKKIEPVEVGDKVDVVTLSDGTKLAMPKIELDLSEYVWVVPEFDTPFNIGEVPFQWGMMPLGAAVFTVTSIIDCWTIEDDQREWEGNSLTGCLLLMLSGDANRYKLPIQIVGNDSTKLHLGLEGSHGAVGFSDWTLSGVPVGTDDIEVSYYGPWYIVWTYLAPGDLVIPGVGKCIVTWKFSDFEKWNDTTFTINMAGGSINLVAMTVTAGSILTPEDLILYGLKSDSAINPDFPGFTTSIVDTPLSVSGLYVVSQAHQFVRHYFALKPLIFVSEECLTEHIAVGDKYVIYNPTTKRLVFNDATKSLIASNWQTGGEGAEISSSPVEYVWDGQGYVYLTSSKTTFSTIQFDDLLQVQAVHGEAVRTIPSHLGERIAVSGETVSRELTNITSILRAGKNTITLTAKNQDGTKVGFVTAVYAKRNMTAVSL